VERWSPEFVRSVARRMCALHPSLLAVAAVAVACGATSAEEVCSESEEECTTFLQARRHSSHVAQLATSVTSSDCPSRLFLSMVRRQGLSPAVEYAQASYFPASFVRQLALSTTTHNCSAEFDAFVNASVTPSPISVQSVECLYANCSRVVPYLGICKAYDPLDLHVAVGAASVDIRAQISGTIRYSGSGCPQGAGVHSLDFNTGLTITEPSVVARLGFNVSLPSSFSTPRVSDIGFDYGSFTALECNIAGLDLPTCLIWLEMAATETFKGVFLTFLDVLAKLISYFGARSHIPPDAAKVRPAQVAQPANATP